MAVARFSISITRRNLPGNGSFFASAYTRANIPSVPKHASNFDGRSSYGRDSAASIRARCDLL
ncbi:hypothetical protein SANTM175S_08538 [Streptomyces antimycoticus]